MRFTTVVAVDARTIEQLFLTWPTWVKHKPEIAANPMLLLCDGTQVFKFDWLKHPDLTAVNVGVLPEGWKQREHMLSSFVWHAPQHVQTDYWLKVDADSIAMKHGNWIDESWFAGDPAMVALPWGYTKPGHWIPQLHEWAAAHPTLRGFPPLDWPSHEPENEVYHHPRIISRQCFINTDWSRMAAALAPSRLPVPSQDTFHWFVAEVSRDLIVKTRQLKDGWTNRKSMKGLKMAVLESWGEPTEDLVWC